jgi:DNA helicase-2/ATP-dependent DNA helicase PcrA
MSPSDYSTTVDSYFASVVLEIYKEYTGRLKADNALDFDDLLLLFRQILDIPEVLDYFHNRFQYFMVDEYQDTNLLQYEIIRILAKRKISVLLVMTGKESILGVVLISRIFSHSKKTILKQKLSILKKTIVQHN